MTSYIEMPIRFKRQFADSLVEDEVFATSQERLDYLNSGLAYAGQLVVQSDTSELYVVNSTVTGYVAIGGSADLAFAIVADYNSLPKDVDAPAINKLFYAKADCIDATVDPNEEYKSGFYLYDLENAQYIKVSSEEQTFAENYNIFNPVGGLKEDYNAYGKTPFEVLHEMLYPVTAPSIALTPADTTYEIGTTVGALNIEAVVTKKSYPIDTLKISVDGVALVDKGAADVADIKDGGTFTTAHTPAANDADIVIECAVTAGTTNATKKSTLSFARASFYGTDSANNVAYTTSDEVRALSGKVLGAKAGDKITINIPVGAKMVVVALPTGRTIASAIYVEGMNAEVKDIFALTNVAVEGAEAYTTETYNVYTFIPVNPFEKTATYKITLG